MSDDPSTRLLEQLEAQGFRLDAGQRRFRLLATHGIPALAATPHGECFSLNVLDGELIITAADIKHKDAYRMILLERIAPPVDNASSEDTPPLDATSDTDLAASESVTTSPDSREATSLPEQGSFQLV